MQRTLLTFSNAELIQIRRLLRADSKACENTGDYAQMEYNEIIEHKITDELLDRIADGA
tara:strand:+ start:316 stop:492 length:177 start_codon:yes stop_codon:yes gene_type:complete